MGVVCTVGNSSTADYIVVGRGTSGPVVANHLSENASVSVLVLKSGPDQTTDPCITDPMAWPSLSGSDLNWQFTIVSQKGLNRRCQEHPAGHVLGGSSAINGLALRSFNGPGPIRSSSPALAQEGNQPLIQAWNADFSDQAYAYTSELVVENPAVGTRPYSATIDPECARRSSADLVHANQEVVLAAGVFQTPKLLELSGVGDPAVLAAHNIPVVIGNPGVGANLQNHLMAILSSPLSRIPETRDLNPGLQALAFVRLDDQEDLRLLDQFLSSDRSAASGRAQAIGSILANPNEALACVFLGKMPGPVALIVLIPLLSAALQRLPIAPSLRKFFDRNAAPTEASLKNTKAALREAALTTHHACGSAAKLPLEKGGVVDTTLTVYGTTNLRVVDAIIFPLMSHAKPDGNGVRGGRASRRHSQGLVVLTTM
ncbi:FAD/NAD(P)-binding domain-containing protein [Aspergillus japonicus CBS 114.51]|uniref:FAD/NAD(P)-binding domain-containing protein n=1 Tax=Aspergillus japonicus CBS 114.51 TaxID=1448312 RepID=A0A8T8X899_ASPJA|nr:FAD/NAD(P)-binding domain-containing protein [Aspergillus japonicus CBS 114.51]RAH84235.1 FAD/NAD(P)-binding domain-containing protein [Aspergillus japonicus CBS 114.51]